MDILDIAGVALAIGKSLIKPISEIGQVKLLTYNSCIEYIVNNRPNDKNIVKAAIMKEEHLCNYIIYQVFLNDENNVVRGS